MSEHMPPWEANELEDEVDAPDLTCTYCGGDGSDPWNDGILPCPECEGEGYKWWLS